MEVLANGSVNFKKPTYLYVYHTVTCIATADNEAFNKQAETTNSRNNYGKYPAIM